MSGNSKLRLVTWLTLACLACFLVLAGCSGDKEGLTAEASKIEEPAPEPAASQNEEEADASEEPDEQFEEDVLNMETAEAAAGIFGTGEILNLTAPATKAAGIVWLGDSLTQGSLGDDGDNLENAPYAKLAGLCAPLGIPVEGYGYYAYVASDIFWRYCKFYDKGEPKNPAKAYVIWVGSNDFALAKDKSKVVSEVEAEIDKFVGDKIDKYIVLSHLPRAESKPGDWYKAINAELKAHYGNRFLDITACAPVPSGFQNDQVHLTQPSYDNVAALVFQKLALMGYI